MVKNKLECIIYKQRVRMAVAFHHLASTTNQTNNTFKRGKKKKQNVNSKQETKYEIRQILHLITTKMIEKYSQFRTHKTHKSSSIFRGFRSQKVYALVKYHQSDYKFILPASNRIGLLLGVCFFILK